MGRDKATIDYVLKFGYGSAYRGKITNKSLTQIIKKFEGSHSPTQKYRHRSEGDISYPPHKNIKSIDDQQAIME